MFYILYLEALCGGPSWVFSIKLIFPNPTKYPVLPPLFLAISHYVSKLPPLSISISRKVSNTSSPLPLHIPFSIQYFLPSSFPYPTKYPVLPPLILIISHLVSCTYSSPYPTKYPVFPPLLPPRQTYVNLTAMLQNNLCMQNNFGLKPLLRVHLSIP